MDQETMTRAVDHGDPVQHENCPAGNGIAVYTGTHRGHPVITCTGCGQNVAA